MRLYDVPAPAKLNLFLHVTGRRDDGYHLLQTVFRFVDLADTLSFERRTDGVVECENSLPGLAPENDLILKAARALQQATGTRLGAQISCVKNIPAGGGLGGGSSDAASTLIALNRLWETGLSRRQLMELALPLGADVPVFIFGRAAFAQGVGELLTAVDLPERSYVIARPAQHVSTIDVFADPDLTRNTKSIKITVFTDWLERNAGLNRVNPEVANPKIANPGVVKPEEAGLFSLGEFGRNDLEPVVRARYEKVEKALAFFAKQNIQARMSGSGACIFAQFATYKQAVFAQQQIIGKIPNCGDTGPVIDAVWACRGLVNHPLRYWTKD